MIPQLCFTRAFLRHVTAPKITFIASQSINNLVTKNLSMKDVVGNLIIKTLTLKMHAPISNARGGLSVLKPEPSPSPSL